MTFFRGLQRFNQDLEEILIDFQDKRVTRRNTHRKIRERLVSAIRDEMGYWGDETEGTKALQDVVAKLSKGKPNTHIKDLES